jgi:hypothetical protein
MAQVSPARYVSKSAFPTTKVTTSALAGALTVLLVWILQSAFHISISAEVAAAFTTVLSFLTGYLTPPAGVDTPILRG